MNIFGNERLFNAAKPGMLKTTAMILFRDERVMLDFAGTIRVESGALRAVYHYDPQVAIVFTGVLSPLDFSRLLTDASEFPGVTHASAEVESIQDDEKEAVTA